MSRQEKEIRHELRKLQDIHCLNVGGYLAALAVSLRMPAGTVKAKIIKSY